MILFELSNSGGCFPEHWLVAGITVSYFLLGRPGYGGGGRLGYVKPQTLKRTRSTTNNHKPYLRVKVTICDHVRLLNSTQ